MNEQFTDFVIDDTVYKTKTTTKYNNRKKFNGFDKGRVSAFIPGAIRNVFVQPGKQVKQGEVLLELEAMKMKNRVTAGMSGVVKSIFVKTGDNVSKDQLLMVIE